MKTKQLLERYANVQSPEQIALDVYTLAEAHVADIAGGQGGHGFDRNAIAAEVDKILIEIKAHVHEILKKR